MKQSELFALLGAPLANTRWSWGSVRRDGVVFLRVWKDRIRVDDGSQFVQITHNKSYRTNPDKLGHKERMRHAHLVRDGAPCFLVMCEATDPSTIPRQIKSFDARHLFAGGRVEKFHGELWVELGSKVRVRPNLPLTPGQRDKRSTKVENENPLPRGWIYKCSVSDPDHSYSWVDEDYGGWLRKPHEHGENWGGEEWIRSPQSWIHLANLRPRDLIFCHQSDRGFRGLVGITVAASSGYPDPDGILSDKCSTLDIGPERIAFEKPVSLDEIRRMTNGDEMGAYVAGKSQATFHPVEEHLLGPLIELCIRKNPRQRDEIVGLSRLAIDGDASTVGEEITQEIIRDPIRREMLIEAFERRASWARLARRLFGFECMVPGCRFELLKEDGELYIEVHHLQAMCEGGSPNDKLNLSVLCPNHHREVHYAATARRKELTRLIKREQARRLAVAKG